MEFSKPFAEVAERITCFVYMAQQVRLDGGVLADDLRQHSGEALAHAERVLRARVRETRAEL